jgi:hypothetical protein
MGRGAHSGVIWLNLFHRRNDWTRRRCELR